MKFFKSFLLIGLFLTAPTSVFACACDYMSINEPFARVTITKTGAAFMTIKNKTDKADALVKAETDLAERTELHTHLHENGVMKMRKVEKIDVPGNGEAVLKPGSYHVMFFGLKKKLEEGKKVPLTLYFEKAGKMKVEIPVKKLR